MAISDLSKEIVTEMADKTKMFNSKSNTLTAIKNSVNNNKDFNLSRSLNDLNSIINNSIVEKNFPLNNDKIIDEKIQQRKIHLKKFPQKSYYFLQNITNRMINNKFRSDHSLSNSNLSTNSFSNKSSTLSLFYQRYLSNSSSKPKRTISGKLFNINIYKLLTINFIN